MSVDVYIYEHEQHDSGSTSKVVQVDTLDGKRELEPVVDADLNRFDEFYSKVLSNGSLSRFERAAIKTYIRWKLIPEKR